MKFRPAYRTQPGLMTIPPGPTGQPLHAHNVVFAIFRRAMDADPSVFSNSMIDRRVSPSKANGAAAAQLITDKLREIVDTKSLNLPVGATVSNHSKSTTLKGYLLTFYRSGTAGGEGNILGG
jgi:hypothetical protein